MVGGAACAAPATRTARDRTARTTVRAFMCTPTCPQRARERLSRQESKCPRVTAASGPAALVRDSAEAGFATYLESRDWRPRQGNTSVNGSVELALAAHPHHVAIQYPGTTE